MGHEFCEAPTLESNEKDSSNEHGNLTFDIPRKPCSFNITPELGMLSAPCTHEDYKSTTNLRSSFPKFSEGWL